MKVAKILGVVSILLKISKTAYAYDTFMDNPYVLIPLLLWVITFYFGFFRSSRLSCIFFGMIGLYYLLVPLYLESGFNISICGILGIVSGVMGYNYLDEKAKELEKSMM